MRRLGDPRTSCVSNELVTSQATYIRFPLESMDEKSLQANNIHCAIQDVVSAAAEVHTLHGQVETQLQALRQKLAAMEHDAINFGCEVRKAIIRLLKINDQDVVLFQKVVAICATVRSFIQSNK